MPNPSVDPFVINLSCGFPRYPLLLFYAGPSASYLNLCNKNPKIFSNSVFSITNPCSAPIISWLICCKYCFSSVMFLLRNPAVIPMRFQSHPIFFFLERECRQRREGERENLKQAPCSVWSLMWGLVPQPWDHDLSWRSRVRCSTNWATQVSQSQSLFKECLWKVPLSIVTSILPNQPSRLANFTPKLSLL